MTVRVLVVDDEPDVEALFRQQFRREVRDGLYTLDFALSALSALAILDDAIGEKIILLVSDINMPGMSGLDLLPIVKTRRPDLPVFMISAYGYTDTVTTALARGADEFLTKPVDFPKLKQAIMAVMTYATGGKRMTGTPVDTTTALHAVIAALGVERDHALADKSAERDAGLAREAALVEELAARTAELAERRGEFGELIAQQAATIDVLKVMSGSPGDPQPVFDLIVERACACCVAELAALTLLDGDLQRLNATAGMTTARTQEFATAYPLPVSQAFAGGRAILTGDTVQVPDTQVDPSFAQRGTNAWHRSVLAVPLLRAGMPIGAIGLGRSTPGAFSAAQVELLKTFAEQAVIAIGSAETYRTLQTRTNDLQETLAYQIATSDVLKVISRSAFDLQPVLDRVVETAARLCDAEMAMIFRCEGELLRQIANFGFSSENEAFNRTRGPFRPEEPSITLRAVTEARAVHIHDVAAVPGYPAVATTLGRQRTSLGVPLMREGHAIGVILLARQRVEPFTDRQIALVSTFADQAVIAIENTRLITEQREALEQQTAIAEVLEVINTSPGDLKPVFDAMLEKAMRLCGAAFGELYTFDGENFTRGAHQGVPAAFAEFRMKTPPADAPGSMIRRLREGANVLHIADVKDDELYRTGEPTRASLVDLGGARTVLTVALRKDESLLGFIVVYRQEVRPFSDRQVGLLQNFAAQAVIAIENARLITEQREALEQQTATAEVLQVINASPGNLEPVFGTILEKAILLCDSSFGGLTTYDGEFFHFGATRGMSPVLVKALRERGPLQPSKSFAYEQIVRGADIVHIPDIIAVGRPFPSSPNIDQDGARTTLFVALRGDDALFGVLVIFRKEVRLFSDRQIALLKNFAAQAVIAMENARLITEQREALEQQTATAEVLQVINASPGNLVPVFDAMLEKAMRLCGATFGSLAAWDGNYANIVAMRGFPPALAEYMAARGSKLAVNPVIAQLSETKRSQQLPDVMAGEGYRNGHPDARAVADLGGARTILHVPLRKDETMLGYISIYRTEVRVFSDKEIALLENFAAQAVIAMENARLLSEQREALEQQTATSEVLQVINASPGILAPVFDAMLERAMRLCGGAIGGIFAFDGGHSVTSAVRGVTEAFEQYNDKHPMDKIQPGTLPARIIETRGPVQNADVTAGEPYRARHPYSRALVELGGIRAVLAVPLLKDGVAVGMVAIYRQEVGAFSDKQIILLQNFAAQAVIAMENARLITEQREALEQQTATAEVLQVINVSSGNLTPVFDTMLENALRLCGAAFGTLYTYDGERFQPVAFRNVAPGFAELMIKYPPTDRAGSPAARVLETKRPVDIPDVMELENYRKGIGAARGLVEVGGVRAFINIPLVKDGKVLGLFTIYRRVVGRVSDKQIALLENFATQVVIAMESARLLHELRARTVELAQRQAELRVTFENMGDGVAMFDETPRLVAWNRKFQDILDLPDGVLAERLTFAEYIRYLAERGEFGAGANLEEQTRRLTENIGQYRAFERTRPDGRVIEIRHNPVAGGGFVLIYADITERKRNEAEIRSSRDAAEEASRTIEAAFRDLKAAQANLIQAEKMASLGQLTAGIAHEIKNPLNFVNNFAELSVDLLGELKDAISPAEAALNQDQRDEVDEVVTTLTSNLEKITEHGKRADGIVKAMLEHSRGSSTERRTVGLNAVIDEALNLAYHGARAQDHSFDIALARDFGEGIAPIEVSPQDITRVFLNLFSNGFYAATRRARNGGDAGFVPMLMVTTRDVAEAIEIRVRDNGAGIPAEIKDKLFQPFFTTKPTGEGTGLGLSITYDIVTKQHGGTIAVESEVNEFSEFVVTLPRQMFAGTGGSP